MKKGADVFKNNKLHFVLVLASVCVVFIETIFPVYSRYSTQLCSFTTVKLKSPSVFDVWGTRFTFLTCNFVVTPSQRGNGLLGFGLVY